MERAKLKALSAKYDQIKGHYNDTISNIVDYLDMNKMPNLSTSISKEILSISFCQSKYEIVLIFPFSKENLGAIVFYKLESKYINYEAKTIRKEVVSYTIDYLGNIDSKYLPNDFASIIPILLLKHHFDNTNSQPSIQGS